MDFLTQETVDKLAQGMRPRSEMDAARLAADNAAAGIEAIPPAPGNVNPTQWSAVVTHPPANKDGVPIPMAAWSTALQMLLTSPTQQTVDQFNASQFGRAGMDGATILQQLQSAPAGAEPARIARPAAQIAMPALPAWHSGTNRPRPARAVRAAQAGPRWSRASIAQPRAAEAAQPAACRPARKIQDHWRNPQGGAADIADERQPAKATARRRGR